MTRTKPTVASRIILLWLAAAISVAAGCHKPAPKPRSSGQLGAARPGRSAHRDELFDLAIGTLDRLEEFDGPEMLQQSVNRLERWVAQQPPPDDWSPDPFIVGLREGLGLRAAEVREGHTELAKLAELEDLDATNSQLGKVSGQFKELSRHSRDLAEATHLVQFLQLAEKMDGVAEELKTLASPAEGETPQETLEKVKAYARIEMPGVQFLALGLDEFSRRIDVEDLAFSPSAGDSLREAVWFRNVSRWVVGEDRGDPLREAVLLFDWTVRNIQLDNEPSSQGGEMPIVVLQHAWETLLFGHGSVLDRVWTFMLLARQRGLDAAVLAAVDRADPEKRRLKLLGIGVPVDGEVYVFDPGLGVPMPGLDGVRLDDGELTISPATLSQLAADDSLLKQMDLDAEHAYGFRSSDFQKVVVLIEMSPSYLSKRMKLVESRLSGEDRLVLTAAPEEQAASFKASPQVVEVRHWEMPYEVIVQSIELGGIRSDWQTAQLLPFFYLGPNVTSPLYRGRMYHFKGVFSGDPNAVVLYQAARPSQRELDALRHQLDQIKQLAGAAADAGRASPDAVRILERAKTSAGYWLGLIHAYQGDSRSAIDYFQKRTIVAYPGGPWTHGAIYNLARAYEAEKRFSEAIELYRLDGSSPGYAGNLLRAKWLEKLALPEGENAPAEAANPDRSSAGTR